MTKSPEPLSSSDLDAVVEEYLRRVDTGENIDQEKFLAEHAEVAPALRSFFANEQLVHQWTAGAPPAAGDTAPKDGLPTIPPSSVNPAALAGVAGAIFLAGYDGPVSHRQGTRPRGDGSRIPRPPIPATGYLLNRLPQRIGIQCIAEHDGSQLSPRAGCCKLHQFDDVRPSQLAVRLQVSVAKRGQFQQVDPLDLLECFEVVIDGIPEVQFPSDLRDLSRGRIRRPEQPPAKLMKSERQRTFAGCLRDFESFRWRHECLR